jgi:hypothetical protein
MSSESVPGEGLATEMRMMFYIPPSAVASSDLNYDFPNLVASWTEFIMAFVYSGASFQVIVAVMATIPALNNEIFLIIVLLTSVKYCSTRPSKPAAYG